MAKKLYEESSVQDIANAIREKNGGATKYKIAEMGAAVRALPTGGTNGIKIIKQNLVDADQIIENQYYEKGVLEEYDKWSATQLIPIEAEVVYAISSTVASAIKVVYTPLFNANKNFVRNVADHGGFITPSDTSYVLWKSPITGYIAFSAMSITISALKMYRCVGSLIEVE